MRSFSLNKNCVIILLLLCGAFIIGLINRVKIKIEVTQNSKSIRNDNKNMLDGCYHVYLDVGSNIGVQIRKLFEPEKYADAHIHKIFNSF